MCQKSCGGRAASLFDGRMSPPGTDSKELSILLASKTSRRSPYMTNIAPAAALAGTTASIICCSSGAPAADSPEDVFHTLFYSASSVILSCSPLTLMPPRLPISTLPPRSSESVAGTRCVKQQVQNDFWYTLGKLSRPEHSRKKLDRQVYGCGLANTAIARQQERQGHSQ